TVAVVGASGAGKSTLLHVLGGLDRPDRGRVVLDGGDLYEMSAGRCTEVRGTRIGFVFQSYHLLPEMDVLENVMLPALARARWVPRYAAVREEAGRLLEAVGLKDRAIHRPMELSGGEQQRVALARALMNDPDLVLADEPTGNLDHDTGRQVLDMLFSLAREKNRSLVLVTHDVALAASCDRVLHLVDGKLDGERRHETEGFGNRAP
ncbi:MAG: ABC transporter ATP-binding protein, partial [Lentisphaerae bacterium]|nr:ABC transporter ATP-binding protein [Lentisphaerota bacterium]